MSDWQEEAAKLQDQKPRHLLFMCVANSARSQLAEGIARHLAPADVKVSSAGSQATAVRPQVIQVLSEIGIDASRQFSKGLENVDIDSVEAVITLCQEEVCPLFPRPVLKFHWALPDPVSNQGTEEDVLARFREVRDELLKRLRVVYSSPRE
jgi:protein-tyrosine-phosphatase